MSMTCFITDVSYNSSLEIERGFPDNAYPASALVTVAALNRPEMLAEIQAVAVLE